KATLSVRARPSIAQLDCSADGNRVVTLSAGQAPQFWDLSGGGEKGPELPSGAKALSVACAPDGKAVAGGRSTGDFLLGNGAPGEELATLSGHKGAVGAVAYSADGRSLISGSADRTAMVWDVAAGRARAVLRSHDKGITVAALSADGSAAATSGQDQLLYTWKIPGGRR